MLAPEASVSVASPGSSCSRFSLMASSREIMEALEPESARDWIFKPCPFDMSTMLFASIVDIGTNCLEPYFVL